MRILTSCHNILLFVMAKNLSSYFSTRQSDFGTIVALLDVLCEDVNGDGVVNGTDIQEVINIIVNAE